MTRAFVGFPAPDPWIAPLASIRDGVRPGRPVPDEDLHLTLAFLDDQADATLEALAEELAARVWPRPRLEASGLGAVGEPPRALALEVAPSDPLRTAFDGVRRAARAAGIALPRTRFRPHVTLRRFARAGLADPRALRGALAAGVALVPAAPEALVLWSSRLTPDGPLYEQMATLPLGPA
ncbi:MAG: RNA 2',3'-cyclic phosphodiesterase [Shimia sp.]